jgi:hypothetical protein
MKLSNLHISLTKLLLDGWARVVGMPGQYGNWHVDPTPSVVQIGHWIHPTTRNPLILGINKNYLSAEELEWLRYNLPMILKDRHPKARYWAGRGGSGNPQDPTPRVFQNFYRTYNRNLVNVIAPSTLRFMNDKERAEFEKKHGLKPTVPPPVPMPEKMPPKVRPPKAPAEVPLAKGAPPEQISTKEIPPIPAKAPPEVPPEVPEAPPEEKILPKAPPEEAPEVKAPEEAPPEAPEAPPEEPEAPKGSKEASKKRAKKDVERKRKEKLTDRIDRRVKSLQVPAPTKPATPKPEEEAEIPEREPPPGEAEEPEE